MLAFIDESGSINPKDPNPISVLLTVCMPERVHRELSRQLYTIERVILGSESPKELKAVELINRRTFNKIPAKRELVEKVFELIGNLEITIFAIVVPRPRQPLNLPDGYLPSPQRFLFQRINALAEKMSQEAILVYDGNGMNIQGMEMAACVSNYIFRVAEPHNLLLRVVDTPLFVDSRVTPGIQIADFAASAIRQYEQNKLRDGIPAGNTYFSAIERYYQIIKSKTTDELRNEFQQPMYGIYRMSERLLYQISEEDS